MNPVPHDERLTAYALGELPPQEARDVEAWLESSPEARLELQEIRGCAELLIEAFHAETERAPGPVLPSPVAPLLAVEPDPVLHEVEFRAESDLPPPEPEAAVPGSDWAGRRRFWLGLGLAATVTALVSSWWWFSTPSPTALAKQQGDSYDTGRVILGLRPTSSSVPQVDPLPGESPGNPNAQAVTSASASTSPEPKNVTLDQASTTEALVLRRDGTRGTESSRGKRAANPAQPQPPSDRMQPELMRRYGLGPPASAPRARGLEDRTSAPADGAILSMDPQGRYGLSPAPATPQAGVSGPTLESLASRFRGGRAEDQLRLAERTFGEGGSNPGYTEAGENDFVSPLTQPLSTFGLDVDTGSYANVRRFLNAGSWPPRAAVRVEEMLNYFDYTYPDPAGEDVFGVRSDVVACPWAPDHRLVRLALKAREIRGEAPVANLVFLVDVSGSMQPEERLPLLKQALRALTKRLAPSDRVAIVTYASGAELRLPSTSGEAKDRILEALDSLQPGGGTHGESGIRKAYEVARAHFIPGGVNRVLLCTDGDFNLGMSDQNALVQMIQSEARDGVFLTTLGVGTDNFKDALMRRLADHGNGSYHYLDTFEEAQRVLLDQRDSRFVVVARDAKAQVEFNPATVAAWRLVGYEKRLLPAEAFNDDARDGGEVGAGQTVTVLYEIVPVGTRVPGAVDPLKYQPPPVSRVDPRRIEGERGTDWLTLKLRYQRPEGSRSVLQEIPVATGNLTAKQGGDADLRLALAVVAFGYSLRDPAWHNGHGFDLALELAREGVGADPAGIRAEFVTLVRKAQRLTRPNVSH